YINMLMAILSKHCKS
ncbi:unnamed protein product, partial [Cuscuta campestris]